LCQQQAIFYCYTNYPLVIKILQTLLNKLIGSDAMQAFGVVKIDVVVVHDTDGGYFKNWNFNRITAHSAKNSLK